MTENTENLDPQIEEENPYTNPEEDLDWDSDKLGKMADYADEDEPELEEE